MNYKDACRILGIEKKHTIEMAKKAYYKKALQVHPDKGGDEKEFKLLHEAYQRVLAMEDGSRQYGDGDDDFGDIYCKLDYSKLLKKALRWLDKDVTWDDVFIRTTFKTILTTCENMSIEIFKKLSVEKSIKFLNIITKHKLIFSLKTETIHKMEEILREKMNDNIIVLSITIDDLLNDTIYKLLINDHEYYIPLWHKYFYIKDENNVMVMNDVTLNNSTNQGHIIRYDNNDILWKMNIKLQDIFDKGYILLNLGIKKSLKIYANELKLVKNQVYTFKNQGVLKVNKNNIYDTSDRADIYIEISLF